MVKSNNSKQLARLLILWLLPPLLLANHVHWLGDYDSALKLAQKDDKPLLVLVVKKSDISSSKIIQSSFMNQPYIDIVNDRMIAVIVTYEGRLSYPIEMYYTIVFPAFFLVDAKSEIFLKEPLYGKQLVPKTLLRYFQSCLPNAK